MRSGVAGTQEIMEQNKVTRPINTTEAPMFSYNMIITQYCYLEY